LGKFRVLSGKEMYSIIIARIFPMVLFVFDFLFFRFLTKARFPS